MNTSEVLTGRAGRWTRRARWGMASLAMLVIGMAPARAGEMAVAVAAPPVQAAEAQVTTEEPRAFGHVIGDLLERQAHITLAPGHEVVPDSLPRHGRVDAWLELRQVVLRPRTGGADLQAVYQLVNAPQQLTTIELPALQLGVRARGQLQGPVAALVIDAWPVTVAPLTPQYVLSRAGLADLQPDIQPQREPTAWLWARLALWCALLALCALPWAVAHYPQLAFWRRRAPFRRAWLDLRRLAGRGGTGPPEQRLVLERLHRAFDAAAGCALFADRLEPLYAAHPRLREAAPEIEAFFAVSRQSFFAAVPPQGGAPVSHDGAAAAPGPASVPALLALCRRLATLEGAA